MPISSYTVKFKINDYSDLKQTFVYPFEMIDNTDLSDIQHTVPEWIDVDAASDNVLFAVNSMMQRDDDNDAEKFSIDSAYESEIINGEPYITLCTKEQYLNRCTSSTKYGYAYITKDLALKFKQFTADEITTLFENNEKNNVMQYFIDKDTWQTSWCGPALIQDGVLTTITSSKTQVAARVALGQIDSEHWILVVVDGKTNQYGTTYGRLQEKMKKLGCINAVCLSSGAMVTLFKDNDVKNRPPTSKTSTNIQKYTTKDKTDIYLKTVPGVLYLKTV